jgi:hypothetical protein
MKKLPAIFASLALLSLIASCGRDAPAAVPATPMVTSVSPTAISSPTTVPEPAATALPLSTPTGDEGSSVHAPQGVPATIDGVFSSGEWDKALRIDLANGELLLMHAGGSLYVGIRSDNLGLGSVCVNWEDEISILHSSAALGTATYVKAEESWQKTRDFSWTNRETSNSQGALEGRREHLER